ncbi:MAG: M16 family metallopeptidase [Dehalococcoidia bacterium]
MFQKSTLPNGLRILTTPMPHTRSVTITVYVGAGSRYETTEVAGLSHFAEHLLFKGSRKRPDTGEIAATIDGVGGLLNGGTDRELTVYYCKVASPHFPLALDVLLDMVRFPCLDTAEMEKERRVILEELAMVADTPAQQADLLIDEVLWPDQPLGRDVAGTPKSVAAIDHDALAAFLQRQYVPNNMVVSVAGNVEHGDVVERVDGLLGDWRPGQPLPWYPAVDGSSSRWAVRYKKTEQAHLCLAVRGVSLRDPNRYPLALLSAILGEGMSSRLFIQLRERRGLAYDVHSYVINLLDTGAFVIYAGVDPHKAVQTTGAALSEMAALKAGVDEAELAKAKELFKGRLLLRMEDTRSVSGWVGSQELLLGQVLTPDEVVAAVEAVTLDNLQRLARQLLLGHQLHLAVVGPFRSDRRFAPLLNL